MIFNSKKKKIKLKILNLNLKILQKNFIKPVNSIFYIFFMSEKFIRDFDTILTKTFFVRFAKITTFVESVWKWKIQKWENGIKGKMNFCRIKFFPTTKIFENVVIRSIITCSHKNHYTKSQFEKSTIFVIMNFPFSQR